MAYDKQFDDLSNLSCDLQLEVIREAELRLEAQLVAANASDQRAMAWAGFLITVGVAAVGGAISLLISKQHLLLAADAAGFAIHVMIAGARAISAVRPAEFCFPGNLPENWLPKNWNVAPAGSDDWNGARREQASDLNNRIKENAKWAKETGLYLKYSIDILQHALIIWSMVTLFIVSFIDTNSTFPSPSSPTSAATEAPKSKQCPQ